MIRKGNSLQGIKYWAHNVLVGPAGIVAYRYYGSDLDKGLHFFKRIDNGALIAMNHAQMDRAKMRPLVIPGGKTKETANGTNVCNVLRIVR